MSVRQSVPTKTARHKRSSHETDAIQEAANGHIVTQYPFGCLGGKPRRLTGKSDMWLVPILLTSPGFGAVGEVGWITLAANSREIVSGTPRREVVAAIKQLRETHGDAIDAAFHQARTG